MRLASIDRPASPQVTDGPLLVLLHGLAADERDLIGLANELDPSLEVVSLRAPYETPYGGFAWFGIEFLPDGGRIIDEEQAESALDLLLRELNELKSEANRRLILGGFSQGAMMSAAALLARPDLIDAAWLMSGRYLPFLDREVAPDKPRPVYVQHGLYDDVLEVSEGRELAEVLAAHGHDVKLDEYRMGHQISLESIRDADVWLRGLLR